MKEAGVPDSLTVINGPEDGAEFSIVRAPVLVGHDAACGVQVRLDRLVQPLHVEAAAVSDGYRVRCSTNAPAWVNGRRVGRARSRVMRNGDVLKIGHTELVLECAPDGLASRSRGIAADGDAVWVLKNSVGAAVSGTRGAVQWGGRAVLAVLRGPKLLMAGTAGAVLLLWPEARYWAIAIVRVITEDVQSLF